MPVYNRNIRDSKYKVTRALTASDSTVTSDDLDLTAALGAVEDIELAIHIPELSATELPSADTIDITVQHGSSATPTDDLVKLPTITGTGSTIAAQTLRVRLPSNTERYVNVAFTSAGTSGDMSDKSATIELLF